MNFSKEFTRYLETVLFGEETSNLQYQLDKVRKRKKQLQIEISSLNAREQELSKLFEEHDVKIAAEKELFKKFIGYMNNRISNAEKSNIGIDFNQAARFLKNDYFPKNGMGTYTVAQIIKLVKKEKFDFEHFRTLRKGGKIEAAN